MWKHAKHIISITINTYLVSLAVVVPAVMTVQFTWQDGPFTLASYWRHIRSGLFVAEVCIGVMFALVVSTAQYFARLPRKPDE
jgi:hypothetical protein